MTAVDTTTGEVIQTLAVDPTRLAELDTLDLLREFDAWLAEPQTLGVRTRLADIEAEIRRRASVVDLTEPAVQS